MKSEDMKDEWQWEEAQDEDEEAAVAEEAEDEANNKWSRGCEIFYSQEILPLLKIEHIGKGFSQNGIKRKIGLNRIE